MEKNRKKKKKNKNSNNMKEWRIIGRRRKEEKKIKIDKEDESLTSVNNDSIYTILESGQHLNSRIR